jgi:hypothetical protein
VSHDRAEEYRKQAEECRVQAALSLNEADKAAWLRMADEWLKLAASVDATTSNRLNPPESE